MVVVAMAGQRMANEYDLRFGHFPVPVGLHLPFSGGDPAPSPLLQTSRSDLQGNDLFSNDVVRSLKP